MTESEEKAADTLDAAQPPAEPPVQPPADDEQRRRFQEALARKHGTTGAATTGHAGPRAMAPASNTARKRQFRRKSG